MTTAAPQQHRSDRMSTRIKEVDATLKAKILATYAETRNARKTANALNVSREVTHRILHEAGVVRKRAASGTANKVRCPVCAAVREVKNSRHMRPECQPCRSLTRVDPAIEANPPVIVWAPGRHGIQRAVSIIDPHKDTTSPLRMDRKAS